MATSLPSRPNLDHLRRQAKTLLASLHDGDAAAARAFIEHLPAARHLTPKHVQQSGFRLADAQSVIARQTGFGSWPLLARHVEALRALEGEWHFASLEIDGAAMPSPAYAQSALLIDGDRFRTESVEGVYEGVFTIDVAEQPARIDIEFVEGPEAGNWSYGIFELHDDQLTLCLGLTGAVRPLAFRTKPGSGHALERLRRASAARPARVEGGRRASMTPEGPAASASGRASAPHAAAAPADAAAFEGPITGMLERLQGRWLATEMLTDGKPLPAEWLAFGYRTVNGRETKVVFGGQTMAHARMRIDEHATPFVAIDYLHTSGTHAGKVSAGILEWIGDEMRILMPPPGAPRPSGFDPAVKGMLSRWKKSG